MFKHLKRLDPGARTAWLELPEVCPNARVELHFAGDTNSGYYNALLARAGRRARKKVATPLAVRQAIDDNRREDRELFPEHVLQGWENILDDKNEPVEPTAENRAEFCLELPDWLFDRIRNFAGDPSNFIDEQLPDGNELGKA